MENLLTVGVEFHLVNLVSKELSNIAKDMLGLDKTTMGVIKNLAGFKTTVIGVGSMAFGAGILYGMEKIADKAGELEKQLSLVKNQFAGITSAQIDGLRSFSIKESIASAAALTPSQMAETVAENFTIFKNLDEAKSTSPMAAQIKGALAANLGLGFDEADTSYKALLKAAELHGDFINKATGKFDAGQGMAAVEDRFKLVESSRGQAKANDILNVEKQATNVLGMMDYKAADRLVAGFVQQFGGYRLGTNLQAFGNQFVAKKMSDKNAGELQHLGLMDKTGGLVGQGLIDKGDIGSYFNLIRDKFHDAFTRLHRAGQSEREFDTEELGKAVSNNTTRRLLYEMMTQPAAIAKEGAGVDMAQSSKDALQNAYMHNMDFNKDALKAAWGSFEQVLGGPAVPVVISVLHGMTSALKFFTTEIARHPTVTKILFEFAAGFAAVAVVGGAIATVVGGIMLLAAAPFGGIILGVTAIAAAVAGFAVAVYANWGKIRAYLVSFGQWFVEMHVKLIGAINNFISNTILPFGGMIVNAMVSLWDKVRDGIQGFFDKFIAYFQNIGKWLTDHMPHLPTWLGGSSATPNMDLPTSGRSGTQNINLNLDGKKVASVVLDHAGNQLSQNNVGETGYNTRVNYTAPGLVAR